MASNSHEKKRMKIHQSNFYDRQVVLRELCSVLSRGTRTYNHLDDLTLLEEESSLASPSQSSASMLLCIVEKSGHDYQTQSTVSQYFLPSFFLIDNFKLIES
jgi:hypothetical protein